MKEDPTNKDTKEDIRKDTINKDTRNNIRRDLYYPMTFNKY